MQYLVSRHVIHTLHGASLRHTFQVGAIEGPSDVHMYPGLIAFRKQRIFDL
jgi:hypothetical protein